MNTEPIINEDNGKNISKMEAEPMVQIQEQKQKTFVEEVRIGDETLFNIPIDMQYQQNNLVYRERKTRWGERQIKRSKIQEDAVFNPLQALYSGSSLLPITQYGQAELEIKLNLYSDGKRRKSKWHHQIEKTFTPPMMNYISPNISVDEIQYILRLYRLDELSSKIKDYAPQDSDIRSPSPQPIYDKDGRRINTREVRKRDALHRQRITLIEDCMKMRKTFIPPQDYKPLKKFKKIYLTETAIKDSKANYIGKIIGPQGSTQKLIEKRSDCKIAVRGRGANKTQKDIFQNSEPLHIIIVADTDQQLEKGVQQVQKVLNGQQDEQMKALQESHMRQLQGIFNDNYCENCEQQGHRTWACPFQQNSNRANVKCSICGESSHPTMDCPQRQAYLKKQQSDQINLLLESQYSQFKSDLNTKKAIMGNAFITDFTKKDLLPIGPNEGQVVPQAKKEIKKVVFAEQLILKDDMPKFDDD